MSVTQAVVSTTKARNIRACERGGLSEVAELFLAIFEPAVSSDATYWARYFENVYFNSPLRDGDLCSLVWDHGGRIDGFLGIIPRHMRMGDRRLAVAVGSLMVRTENGRRNPAIAVRLLHTFLNGPQDLSLTHTANDQTRALWCSYGGATAFAYSNSWLRPHSLSSACRTAPAGCAGSLGPRSE